jgi:hypothetical protein
MRANYSILAMKKVTNKLSEGMYAYVNDYSEIGRATEIGKSIKFLMSTGIGVKGCSLRVGYYNNTDYQYLGFDIGSR